MLLYGKLINKTGRHKHIFKRTVWPGGEVDLKELYTMYKNKCDCSFDERFVKWLRENKIPNGEEDYWEFKYKTILDVVDRGNREVVSVGNTVIEYKDKLSAHDIANLRVKDKPDKLLEGVDSIAKLRKALTVVNKKKNKAFLAKAIKKRIKKLKK